ncbi:MAG: ATP-binding cassette domain-containing protein [Ruminococcus sp.]|nr:ATP-binding cassette domain-containing protein [Ruminococcus sp.]
MSKIIEINNLCKSFKEADVLKNITFSVERGKIVGIIGRNGSGKTVLFKCICGLNLPTKGTVKIDNKELSRDMDIPDKIGVIIENPGFLPNYNGFKNLRFLAMIKNKIDDKQIKETIKLVGLNPESKKHVGKYSLGMRQRLGIAQAIMENPDILILDEPMNGLDNDGVQDMRKLFLDLKEQGKTILLASHNKEDIEVLCDEVYMMDKGVLTQIHN